MINRVTHDAVGERRIKLAEDIGQEGLVMGKKIGVFHYLIATAHKASFGSSAQQKNKPLLSYTEVRIFEVKCQFLCFPLICEIIATLLFILSQMLRYLATCSFTE